MALFSRKPKLPSYVGMSLDALLQDSQWSYAISQAGVSPSNCEVVLHLADATIGLGSGVPTNASPAILFGQGTTLAMAYPTEREVKVQRRDARRAELQTQRSGWFQILFGPAENLDGFFFLGPADNLQLGTPEGEKFGQAMSAFLRGQLRPQQVIGTPQSLVARTFSVETPAPEFADPDDALRWKLVFAAHGAVTALYDKFNECFEHADKVERAFGMANADFVNGIQQQPSSRNTFRALAVRLDEELPRLLAELREKTSAAASQWNDLMFLLPGEDNPILKLVNWCEANGVPSEIFLSLAAQVPLVRSDFGLTRESFWTENERVVSVVNSFGQ